MPSFEKRHPVSHCASDMFDLVADVERYPEFVPLCHSLTIRSRREKGGKSMLVADMTAAYKAIRETFTCQVLLDPKNLKIEVQYLDGPFKYLQNHWTFVPEDEIGCVVRFWIDYEFKSKMLGMVMGSMFESAFKRFTRAFEDRANQIYGSKAPLS